jgi:hypothetical protein
MLLYRGTDAGPAGLARVSLGGAKKSTPQPNHGTREFVLVHYHGTVLCTCTCVRTYSSELVVRTGSVHTWSTFTTVKSSPLSRTIAKLSAGNRTQPGPY